MPLDGDATRLPINGHLDDEEVAAAADAVIRWAGGAGDELSGGIRADEAVVDDPPDRACPAAGFRCAALPQEEDFVAYGNVFGFLQGNEQLHRRTRRLFAEIELEGAKSVQ
ncbi:MAG TPA: hypothetical protein PJ981_15920 [Accumulibacter sp.]|nr:hypothetical protein [Accumulibacter sp.]